VAGSSTSEGRRASDPPNRTTYLIKQLELALRPDVERLARQHGLTALKYNVLTALRISPGISSAEVARRTYVTPQTANEMLLALADKGAVRRKPMDHNKRVFEIHLTAKGTRLAAECDADMAEVERRLVSTLSEEDVAYLRHLLRACYAAFTTPAT
jgi:DNA-binding MarR family transcriptional regulator